MSIAGGILLDVFGVDPCPMVRRTLLLSGTLEEVTVLLVILEFIRLVENSGVIC